MRNLTTTLFIASVILVTFSGCGDERDNMRVAPNRDGHAYFDPAHKPNIGIGPVANPEDETYHTVKPGDTLSSISKKYNMSVESLIKRNQFKPEHKLNAGDQIIVNKK